MPVKKLILKAGLNKENTRYTTEGGWYDCDKIRFRQGTPEKIGGWVRLSEQTYLGVCRSLGNWVTLAGANLLGVGTHLKFYLENGGLYYDITPIRATSTLTDPFTTTIGLTTVTVADAAGGYRVGDYVTFSGASAVGGLDLNGEYVIQSLGVTDYTITAASPASSTATGGGVAVTAAYQIHPGLEIEAPVLGWGAGGWGTGVWGTGTASIEPMRLWSQSNFGEDLIFGPRGGPMYYWTTSSGLSGRGVALDSLGGASDVPTLQNHLLVSDISRFVLTFGCTDYSSLVLDPMLIRWSDQESAVNWTPAATNQAGSLRLSNGSAIEAVRQTRQEILVWTDTALYSLQYVGAPIVWGANFIGDNISILSKNAVAHASGITYWMGGDKFYVYDGRIDTLRCDVLKHVFNDIDLLQSDQVFAGTNEGFNEVWWFYCSAASTTVDRYVVYNYAERIWYYGNIARTAWLDSALRRAPIAATYSNNIVEHEIGNDDGEVGAAQPIHAYITSSEFDLDDGHNFSFVWRVLPDISFQGSSAAAPQATMYLLPLKNSGSGYTDPASVAGVNNAPVTRTATLPIEAFTGQIYTRVRGRQMSMKIESTALGVAWQLGAPRLDLRPDGRR